MAILDMYLVLSQDVLLLSIGSHMFGLFFILLYFEISASCLPSRDGDRGVVWKCLLVVSLAVISNLFTSGEDVPLPPKNLIIKKSTIIREPRWCSGVRY